MTNKPTSLEQELYSLLQSMHITFTPQYTIRHYIVDAFIEPNIVIEVDGNYWHGHPDYEPLTDRQKKQRAMDKSRDNYFGQRGYAIIRIWESDLSYETLLYLLHMYKIIS
jgi:very-short-patch-repair endonuclease